MRPTPAFALAAVAGLLAVTALALIVPWGASSQYGAYGEPTDPSQLSLFRRALEDDEYTVRTLVGSPLLLADLREASGTLYLVNGVEREYTDREVDALVAFTERGGRLLVLDDFQHGYALAARFGVQVDRTPLLDANFNSHTDFVRSEGLVDGKTYPALLFNGASTLSVDQATARTLANSSGESYADLDGDRNVTQGDRHGPFPLAVAVGAGPVAVFVSDASLLANDLIAQQDVYKNRNLDFGIALVRHLVPRGSVVLVDESRHANGAAEPSYRALALLVTAARTPVGMVALAVAAAGSAGLLAWTATKESARKHVQDLTTRRPRVVPEAAQRERLRALVLAKLEGQANVADAAAFARAERAEAQRLLGDAELAAFAAEPATSYRSAEWARILQAATRYLQ